MADFSQLAKEFLLNPNFVKWFGKSKVVDKAGAPLRVYHGTKTPFTEFRNPPHGEIGFHFGSAEQAENRLKALAIADGNEQIMPTYLNIQNPLRLDKDPTNWYPSDFVDILNNAGHGNESNLLRQELEGNLQKYGYGERGVVGKLEEDFYTKKAIGLDEYERLSKQARQEWANANLNSAKNRLSDLGYDGIVYKNSHEGGGNSYIAFNPTQVKSAIGNRGTFDPTDPNILRGAAAAGLGASLYSPESAQARQYQDMASSQALKESYSPVDLMMAAATGGAGMIPKLVNSLIDAAMGIGSELMD